MLKAGAILPVFLTLTLLVVAYVSYTKIEKYPNSQTQNTAKLIPRFPDSDKWQISNSKSLCFYYLTGCKAAVSTISFTTRTPWTDIYWFYRQNMEKLNWQYSSNIVTSIPSSMVFDNKNLFQGYDCQATLVQNKAQSNDSNSYTFSVSCSQN